MTDHSVVTMRTNQRERKSTNSPPATITKKHNQKEWLLMYGRLRQFKETTGHCNVPKRYSKDQRLGHWVHYQRTMFKKFNLAEERIQMLENLGFTWMERPTTGVYRGVSSWEARYEELKEFKKIHGHCKVPRNYPPNPALGRWVKWQRYNRTLLDRGESSVLDKRRIKLLNAINFSWGYQRIPPKKQNDGVAEPTNPALYAPSIVRSIANDSIFQNKPESIPQAISTNSTPQIESLRDVSNVFDSQFHLPHAIFSQEKTDKPFPLPDSSVGCYSKFDELPVGYFRNESNPTTVGIDDFPTIHNSIIDFASNYEYNMSNTKDDVALFNAYDFFPSENQNVTESRVDKIQNKHKADKWKCAVCKVASFRTYDEALAHENSCSGFIGNDFFDFCQACS